jgi:hypothetical protein
VAGPKQLNRWGDNMAKKKPAARGASGDGAKRRLHAFFRKLYSDPELMEKFGAGPSGRDAAMKGQNLTDEHQNLLRRGCVPEVIRALVGADASARTFTSTIVEGHAAIACAHPECQAFARAARKLKKAGG